MDVRLVKASNGPNHYHHHHCSSPPSLPPNDGRDDLSSPKMELVYYQAVTALLGVAQTLRANT